MKREDIKRNIKEKMLFEGLTACGKTWLSLRIAKLYLMNGKKVVYIDPEHGIDRELQGYGNNDGLFDDLTDEELDNIDIIYATNIVSYIRAMHGWTEEKQIGTQVIKMNHYLDCDLKICDGLTSEIELYKTALTQKFIKQGYYTIGEKQFPISNPDTFVLPYQFYAKLYDQIKEALVTMMSHKYDLICTMHPLKETASQKDLEQSIYQKFDSVIRLNKIVMSTGFPKWSGVTVKNRGRESPEKSNVLDNVDLILTYYIKKFDMDLNDTRKKLGLLSEA